MSEITRTDTVTEELTLEEVESLTNLEDYEVYDEERGEWVPYANSCYTKIEKQGFPFPETAEFPVTAITIKNNIDGTYHVWGVGEYSPESCELDPQPDIVYHRCDNEVQLLLNFLDHWDSERHSPDVVTGWNTRLFDIPYLVNRISNILGEDMTKKCRRGG